jgi:hypothetical protein
VPADADTEDTGRDSPLRDETGREENSGHAPCLGTDGGVENDVPPPRDEARVLNTARTANVPSAAPTIDPPAEASKAKPSVMIQVA